MQMLVYCFLCLLQTESREDGTEFIVTNTDQGNTVAGKFLKRLLENIKILHTQIETFEKQLTQLTDKESISQKDIADLKGAFEDHVMKFQKHCEEATMRQDMQELSSEISACHSKENELQSELKAAKEEYDKKIRSLSETIVAMETKLSTKESELKATKEEYDEKIRTLSETIVAMETKLSTKENELQSELKATKEEYDEKIKSLSENIEKIRQPSLEGDAAGDNASTPITALLSTLDELAAQMVPKETTNKRRSMMESHDNEFRTAHGILLQDSFDDSITGSPILPRTYSGSSSGIGSSGTLGRDDSSKQLLLIINEDEPSQSEDQLSSQATDVQQSLPPSASKVSLRQKKTSTPAINRAQSIISEKENNYLGVVWAMSDLTVAIKKLLETDSSN